MGNDQSHEQKLSQSEVNNLLEAQRRQYEKKCQEYVKKAQIAAQNTQTGNSQTLGNQGLERQRAPYNYARDDLQNIIQQSSISTPNLYPNLHQSPSCSTTPVQNYNANEYIVTGPPKGFVFVNNNGQAESSRPSAPPQPRNRSVSRSRHNNDEINCPTCRTPYGLMIHQCNNGHSACKNCKDYRRPCGLCGNPITDMRNYPLEEYVSQRKVPCPHETDGCKLVIKLIDMESHVKECPFKELQCPLGCYWKGKLNALSRHFDSMHPKSREADVGTEIRLQNIISSSQNVFLVLLGAYNFLFHIKVSELERKIYMTAQLIGTAFSASKWSYEIQVYNKNECRRKYTYTDLCGSYTEPVENIFKEERCSVLPYTYASTYLNSGALTFKFFIKKTDNQWNRAKGPNKNNMR